MDNAERRTVLLTPCRWCGAGVNEECTARPGTTTPLTTLEGGFHDTRMRDALHRAAAVVRSSALPMDDPVEEPMLVGAGERPW